MRLEGLQPGGREQPPFEAEGGRVVDQVDVADVAGEELFVALDLGTQDFFNLQIKIYRKINCSRKLKNEQQNPKSVGTVSSDFQERSSLKSTMYEILRTGETFASDKAGNTLFSSRWCM